jgi:protein tyrosine/serine phosphatase
LFNNKYKKIKEVIKILIEEHNSINLFWNNFHKVDDGIYRSAQILPWKLKKIIKKNNIKTIINLRGKNNYLYKKEKEIAEQMGVEYIEISISSRTLPKIEEVKKLKDILLNENKKPILFHCKAGADRTGFVAVLYGVLKGKDVKSVIKKELRLKYGFIALSKAGRVKEFFSKYDNKQDFIEWARENRDKIQNNFSENPFIDFIYEKVLRRE